MSQSKARVRQIVKEFLVANNDAAEFADDQSLFVSGRLNSLTAVKLILKLEKEFQINSASIQEISDIDTIDGICKFTN